MRCKFLVSIILLALIICSAAGLASACIELKTAKAVYFPGETAQIEIDANVTRIFSSNDVFFYRDITRLPIAMFFSKVTNTKYFVWFDLPDKTGSYTIKARGYCPNLKIVELPIEIQETIALQHLNFKARIEDKWKTLPLETHILGAGALRYDEIAQQAFSEYIKRADSCINSACNTKDVALTLAAFDNVLLREEMIKMLDIYQNSFREGEYQLQISSLEQKCNITIKNATTTMSVSNGINFVNLTNIFEQSSLDSTIRFELTCENNFNATLIYLYKDFSKEFELVRKNGRISGVIDNSGCFGEGLKTNCDAGSTAYALFALALTDNLNLNDSAHIAALNWLEQNAVNAEEKAVLYYITKNNETLTWLLNVQDNAGFWYEEYKPGIKATALILFILKHSNETETANAVNKAEVWLKSQEFVLEDEAFVLFLAFSASDIEPLLSIWPGFVKTYSKDSFNLILTNQGTVDIEVNAKLFNFNKTVSLKQGSIKNVRFDVPTVMTLDGRSILSNLALDYSSSISDKGYFYSIPLLIFSEQGDKEYIGAPNATEQEINQTGEQNIINGTNLLENKTTELNESLIEKKFRFVEKNMTLEITTTDTLIKHITLGNALDENVTDIELSPSIALQQFGFVEVSPAIISNIGPGEKVKINITIDPTAVLSQTYKGYIQASAKYGTKGITANIPLTLTVSGMPSELQNCSELGGVACDPETMECETSLESALDTSYCCIPAEACKKKVPAGRNIGLILVAVIIVVLLVLLFILRKKPKKEMKAFLEEKAKELESKRIKRPPSITKKPETLGLSKSRGMGISGLPKRRPFA